MNGTSCKEQGKKKSGEFFHHHFAPSNLWPDVAALLLVPISAHALFARPLVVAPASVIAVEILSPTASGVVWAHCATGTESATWRSTDSGAHFHSVPGPPQPNAGLFAAASADTAVLGAGPLFRITGGGAHYAPIPTGATSHLQYLGFTDATHGVALGYDGSLSAGNERLYYTSDGGATYSLVSTA